MNPELLPVLDEISAVLKKHDLAGVIILANKTHTDFRIEIQPAWSCAWTEKIGNDVMVRVRCKRADYPTREAQAESLRLTLGALLGMADGLRFVHNNVQKIVEAIGLHVDFSHRSWLER